MTTYWTPPAPKPPKRRSTAGWWISLAVLVLMIPLGVITISTGIGGQLRALPWFIGFFGLVIWMMAGLLYLLVRALSRPAPMPVAGYRPQASSWRDAEHATAQWLAGRGETGIRVGAGTRDGGVDVETSRYVVQVKDWAGNVGGPAVRQIHGVAAARGKRAMMVARAGFTRDAVSFARMAGVELWVFGGGVFRQV